MLKVFKNTQSNVFHTPQTNYGLFISNFFQQIEFFAPYCSKQMSTLHLLCEFKYLSKHRVQKIHSKIRKLKDKGKFEETLLAYDDQGKTALEHFLKSVRTTKTPHSSGALKYIINHGILEIINLLSQAIPVDENGKHILYNCHLGPMFTQSSYIYDKFKIETPYKAYMGPSMHSDARLDYIIYNIIIGALDRQNMILHKNHNDEYAYSIPDKYIKQKELEHYYSPEGQGFRNAKNHFKELIS